MQQNTLDSGGWAVYKRLFSYAAGYWPMFILAGIGMVAYALSEAAFAALMKPLLDSGFVEHDARVIRWLPWAIVAIFMIRGFASFASGYCMGWIGRQAIKNLRQQLFAHYLNMPTAFYDQSASGVLLSKMTFNIEQIANSTTDVVKTLVQDTLTILALLGLMFYYSPFLTLFMVMVTPLIAGLMRFLSHKFRSYSSRIQNSMGDVTRVADEAVDGHRVIKVFNGQEYEQKRFEAANEYNRRMNMKLIAARTGSMPVIQLLAASGIAGVVYVAISDILTEPIEVGTFVSLLGAVLLLMAPLKRMTNVNAPLQQGIAAGHSIFEVLDQPLEDSGGDVPLEKARGQLEFVDVTFKYQSSHENILDHLSLTIDAGETLAIVGRSGSGKSTLVSLLPRFYDPDHGSVRMDGFDLRDYPLSDLRAQISLVSQDVVLFNDTIANNIAYGALEVATEEQIREAAGAAHVMEFVEEMPAGFDTMVGDKGVLLSGGQRQRIAIARALLRNSPVLLLDEATSALDTESERKIQQALHGLMQNRTTLVIAHRLSTVENADRILVLDKGRIVEIGSHKELLAREGHYAALYQMQFHEV
ncbi:MAG: lipid A export permease/ATP-binding protein MsbA [Gammaproteobacteria bacterium]|nr:lipid A export permease/ATP-binding protein MsbA [Gammaproteobacteria bacterium]